MNVPYSTTYNRLLPEQCTRATKDVVSVERRNLPEKLGEERWFVEKWTGSEAMIMRLYFLSAIGTTDNRWVLSISQFLLDHVYDVALQIRWYTLISVLGRPTFFYWADYNIIQFNIRKPNRIFEFFFNHFLTAILTLVKSTDSFYSYNKLYVYFTCAKLYINTIYIQISYIN